jgi:serine/threonine protein kinase
MVAEEGGGGAEERAGRTARLFQEFLDGLDQGRDLSVELLARAGELAPDLEAKIRLELELRTLARDIGVGEKSPGAPQSLGRFQILGLLGQGGISRVFQAFDPKLGRKIALKVLDREALLDKDQRSWILNEARSLARLDHPHVVKVFEIGETSTHAYVAMEQLTGPSLNDVIAEWVRERDGGGSPPAATVSELAARLEPYSARIELLVQLAEALAYCHDHGVLHRDIKPRNVLFDEHGAPRLIDFGLAHVEGADEDSRLGLTQTLVGTAANIAPEQVASDKTGADPRSDQFSFATLAYECFALVNPFVRKSRRMILAAVEEADPEPLRRKAPAAPPALATVIGHAHAADPAARYPGMAALAADLRAVLANRPLSVEDASLPQLARLWFRRHRRGVVAVGVTLAAVLALVSASWFLSKRSERAEILAAARSIRPEEFVGDEPFDASYGPLLELGQRARAFDEGQLSTAVLGHAWPEVEKRIHAWALHLGKNYEADVRASKENKTRLQEALYRDLFAKEAALCPRCEENLSYRRRGTLTLPLSAIGTRSWSLEVLLFRDERPEFYSQWVESPPARYPLPGTYRLSVWEPGASELDHEVVFGVLEGWRPAIDITLVEPRADFLAEAVLVKRSLHPIGSAKALKIPAFRLLPRLVTAAEFRAFARETGYPLSARELDVPEDASVCTSLAGAMAFATWAGARLPFSQEVLLAEELGSLRLVPEAYATAEYLLDASPNDTQSFYLTYHREPGFERMKLVIDPEEALVNSNSTRTHLGGVGLRLVWPADTPDYLHTCASDPLHVAPLPEAK